MKATAYTVIATHLKFAPVEKLVLGKKENTEGVAMWWRAMGYATTVTSVADPRITGRNAEVV